MGRADQLHTTLCNRPARQRLRFRTNLVHDHDFRHVVLHGLDHHAVLLRGVRHLHPPRPSNRRMRHIAIPADFIARVDDDHTLVQFIAQYPGHLANHRRFAHARSPQEEDRVGRVNNIPDHVNVPRHRPPNPAGETNNRPTAIANRGDTMQRTLDPGTVVTSKVPQRRRRVFQVVVRDHLLPQVLSTVLSTQETRLRATPQVQHHLEQLRALRMASNLPPDILRKHTQQRIQVVPDDHRAILKLVPGRRRIAFFLGAFRELASASETARVGLQTLQALIDGTRIETLVKARAIFSGRSSDDQSRTLERP
mmetsp:Transcript_4807/g.13884  ORF Transcript_4807/g.13884 Transcript_4807/m.13884 type:complete len:309 (+) Transcript_4807:1559-2485(+)